MCEHRRWGRPATKTGAASPLLVTGLTGGKHYHCRVRATNAIGTGPYSAYGATVLVTTTAPGCPTVTGSTPSAWGGHGGVQPAGQQRRQPDHRLHRLVCEHRRWGDQGNDRSPPARCWSPGLTSGKHYHCRVRATNAIGTGAYSAYGATVLVPAAETARAIPAYRGDLSTDTDTRASLPPDHARLGSLPLVRLGAQCSTPVDKASWYQPR